MSLFRDESAQAFVECNALSSHSSTYIEDKGSECAVFDLKDSFIVGTLLLIFVVSASPHIFRLILTSSRSVLNETVDGAYS